ncbi:hypothetical protein [Neobacillus thermocopriae]|uniref:hypothetical protein n=1 Tax=Neobacillus thermocopriae TaxID=1215031 RepID=UPI00376FE9DC
MIYTININAIIKGVTVVKLILVMTLLSIGLFSVIISMDLLMGLTKKSMIATALNPFKVMEATEYFILFLLFLVYIVDMVGAYLNKKRQSPPQQNSTQQNNEGASKG